MDLSPRTEAPESTSSTSTPRRRWVPIIVLALVLVAGGMLVTQFLRSAVDYFCNVDEIGQRDGCEEGRRLRIQGTVDAGTVDVVSGVTTFTMSFNGATLPVRYDGEPGGMFEECQPVVVHGKLEGGEFRGDRVEVKHSNEYEAENAERVDEGAAAAESTGCATGT